MNYGIYAIHSRLTDSYDGLFLFRTELQAQFEISKRIPEDRRKYETINRIGNFDITTGIIKPYDTPVPVDYITETEIQTPLRKGSPEQQHADFVESTADINKRF